MSTPRHRSSSASSTPAKRNGKAAAPSTASPQTPAPLPAPDDRDGWRAHWQAQGQSWRTEPEIDRNRQKELEARRAIVPDIGQGVYPFKGVKLSRADVECLLATHENGRGPVDWSDEKSLYEREGLDLRGADLRAVNLDGLPLARMRGGLDSDERQIATAEQAEIAAVQLQGALLRRVHLEGAALFKAHLEEVNLFAAYLKQAYLRQAHLERADLFRTDLEGAILKEAHLEGASLKRTRLEGADLANIIISDEKHISCRLIDINWGNANIAVIDWSGVSFLGDEHKAHQRNGTDGRTKAKERRLSEYRVAVRANRQLALALQSQGLNEEAARFAYRAQALQRKVFWQQRNIGQWLFSWFLFLLAGYGYRPGQSFLAYFLVISGFATAYYFLGHAVGPTLSPLGAFVFSMTSFHGRGFFPGNNISLDDPLTVLAALEALVGLIIEVTFIATLTQRFFNR